MLPQFPVISRDVNVLWYHTFHCSLCVFFFNCDDVQNLFMINLPINTAQINGKFLPYDLYQHICNWWFKRCMKTVFVSFLEFMRLTLFKKNKQMWKEYARSAFDNYWYMDILSLPVNNTKEFSSIHWEIV